MQVAIQFGTYSALQNAGYYPIRHLFGNLASMPKKSPPRELEPAEVLALSRVTNAKALSAARKQLDEGEIYLVDMTVRVHGELVVNHDQEVATTTKPTTIQLAASLLEQFGPRKRAAIVQQIVESGTPGEVSEDLEQLAQRLIDGLSTDGTQTRKGAVTGKLSCQAV